MTPVDNRKKSNDPNRALMRAMGGSSYTAIPPDQHNWQMAPGEAPIHRIWSWMIQHTCPFGHQNSAEGRKKAYATDEQSTPLFIEHLASDLAMEEHNCREEWRKGVRKGYWRNGDPAKNENKRRLYLCARVKPAPVGEVEDEKDGSVQTPFPPYIYNQIKDWPPERVQECTTEYLRNQRVEKNVLAELMAEARGICRDQLHNTWADRWKLRVIRLEGEEDDALSAGGEDGLKPEERVEQVVDAVAALQEELADLADEEDAEALAMRLRNAVGVVMLRVEDLTAGGDEEARERRRLRELIQGSVQTHFSVVQRLDPALYAARKGGSTPPRSLLGLANTSKGQRVGVETKLDTPSRAETGPSSVEKNAPKQVHRESTPEPPPEVRKAAETLIAGVAELQRKEPDRFVAEVVSPESKADVAWAVRIVAERTGVAGVDAFLPYLAQRATEKALGYLIAPGLIFEWAGDYHRSAPEIARRQQAREAAQAAETERLRQAAIAQAERNEREDRIREEARDRWERMEPDERAGRVSDADYSMRRDPMWEKVWRFDSQKRLEELDRRALAELRREIEEREIRRHNQELEAADAAEPGGKS